MQIIKKYIKIIRNILSALAGLLILLVIVRNIPAAENLYQFIKIFLITVYCIWVLLYSSRNVSEIRFLFKPLKYIIISLCSLLLLILAFLIIWYNYFFFPGDTEFLKNVSDSVKYNGDQLEQKEIDLIREIKSAWFSSPLSKEDIDFLTGNLKEKDFYINSNPYGNGHPNNWKYSTGKIFYYIYQKNSIVLKADSVVSYPVGGSIGSRFLELDAVFPGFKDQSTDGILNIYYKSTSGRAKLLEKIVKREKKPDIMPFRYSSPLSSISFYLKHPGRSVMVKNTGWEKVRIDLPKDPGKLEIEFKADTGNNNYLFIGSPAIYRTRPKMRNDHINIVYLIFDTLSKQHVDLYEYYDVFSNMNTKDAFAKIGNRGIITPTIDGYTDRICLLENMYSVGQVTRPAIVPLWTSRFYTESRLPVFRNIVTGENEEEFYNQNFNTLGNELSKYGYFTKQISCNAQGHGVSGVGVDLGFDENYDYTMEATEKTENFRRIIEFLDENQSRKFFLYAHINLPHTPRWIPMKYFVSALPDVRFNTGSAVRLGNIRYMESSMAAVMHAMEKLKLLENTIVIITADHGSGRIPYFRGRLTKKDIMLRRRESQQVADYPGRAIYTRKGGLDLYNDYVNIPWILIKPGNSDITPGRIDSYISSLDVTPTLLDIAVNKNNAAFSGKSFRNILKRKSGRDEVFSGYIPLTGRFQRGFIIDGRYKYWRNQQGLYQYRTENGRDYLKQQESLYDLKTDPNEIKNLAADTYDNQLLQRIRKIYSDKFIDYPDKNFIQIAKSAENKTNYYNITASSRGKIIIPKTYGDDIGFRYNSGNEIVFNCKVSSKPALFSFETDPPDSRLMIEIKKDGKPLPRTEIFSTVENINFFENPILLNGFSDFYIAREPGRTGLEIKDIPDETVFYSRIPLNYWLEMNVSDKDIKLSPGMKEVLRGWGYIQ